MDYYFDLPYYRETRTFTLDRKPNAVLTPRLDTMPMPERQAAVVEQALDNPIGSPRLKELAKGRKRVCVITSDHTRPVPSKITMPLILARIRQGNPDADVTILIATGCHRATTDEELREKFGDRILEGEKILIHDSEKAEDMKFLGTLPSGGECIINRHALEPDLLVSEGFIEPHFFAGYSGGRKAVLPGVASRTTVFANHCSKFIADPASRAGNIDNNPIHEDMIYAAGAARLDFIVNVVLNERKEIVHAVAGHFDNAHRAGCAWLSEFVRVPRVQGDIVITSNGGYPLDQNVYQAVKGMTTAGGCCRDGGVIIIAASCCDSHGGEGFYQALKRSESPTVLLQEIEGIPAEETRPDQWQYQILARILKRCTVILVSDMCDPAIIADMKMLHATTPAEAMNKAKDICRASGTDTPEYVVIPDGVGVVVGN